MFQLGEPSRLCWKQPCAKVPGHPGVEAFFQGPEKTLKYTNVFSGIAEARKWVAQVDGRMCDCHMNLSTGGTGRDAFVRITKTEEGYHARMGVWRQVAE